MPECIITGTKGFSPVSPLPSPLSSTLITSSLSLSLSLRRGKISNKSLTARQTARDSNLGIPGNPVPLPVMLFRINLYSAHHPLLLPLPAEIKQFWINPIGWEGPLNNSWDGVCAVLNTSSLLTSDRASLLLPRFSPHLRQT